MGDFAREGSYYQGRRSDRRNPVFNFKIQPNYNLDIEVSDVREMIYRMFMEPQRDSDSVQVLLKDDRRPDRYFIGYTETITAPIFEKDAKAQCSLQTTDAYLRSADLTEADHAMGWFNLPLTYEGSADTGIEMTIKVLSATPLLTIQNGDDIMVLQPASMFVPDDIVHINTTQGSRTITVNGVDAMSALPPTSPWISLKEQGNTLKIYGSVVSDGRAALTSYSYRAAWWGI